MTARSLSLLSSRALRTTGLVLHVLALSDGDDCAVEEELLKRAFISLTRLLPLPPDGVCNESHAVHFNFTIIDRYKSDYAPKHFGAKTTLGQIDFPGLNQNSYYRRKKQHFNAVQIFPITIKHTAYIYIETGIMEYNMLYYIFKLMYIWILDNYVICMLFSCFNIIDQDEGWTVCSEYN